MKGLLVVNGFIKSQKFLQLYTFFENGAKKLGIQLQRTTTDALCCKSDGQLAEINADFILFWDKDVFLAYRLENAGHKVFNGAKAIALCDSKILTCLALKGKVPMPPTLFAPKTFEGVGYPDTGFVSRAAKELGLPLVIKQAYGSFGQQVYLAKSVREAQNVVTRFAGKDMLFQRYEECGGSDIRINVVGGKVINALRRQSNGDFRSNVTLGGSMTEVEPTPEQKRIALTATETLGLHFAGVDILPAPEGDVLCEVNSNMHFKSTFDCTGTDLSQIILQHVQKVI